MDGAGLGRDLGNVNAIKIGADEMVQMIAAVEQLPPSACYDDAGALVRQMFPCDVNKQRAVLLRCHALVETIDRECSWLKATGERDVVLVEPAMSAAAASCRLVIREGALVFDRDQFLHYTLSAAKPAGHA